MLNEFQRICGTWTPKNAIILQTEIKNYKKGQDKLKI